MLSRTHRFHGHNTVRNAYRSGRAVRGSVASLHFYVNERRRSFRAAVVVSRKVNKSAVTRNRIRRRVYEVLRNESSKFEKPYDLVVTVYDSQMADMSAGELKHAITGLLKDGGIVPH
jgi:ribonuclease P protein component